MRGQKRVEDARERAYDPRIHGKKFFRSGWIAGSSPAMTNAGLHIAPHADGSHVRVAVFIVNNRPETMERIRPHVKVGSSHDAALRPVSRAQRSTSEAKWCAADPGSFRSV